MRLLGSYTSQFIVPDEDEAVELLLFQLFEVPDAVPELLLLFQLPDPFDTEAEALADWVDVPLAEEPAFIEPVDPEPEEAIDPEAEASAFKPVPVVVPTEALTPELADEPFEWCVLLQLANTIASGNTKNTFFIN